MKKDKNKKNKGRKEHKSTSGDAQYILGIVRELGREANLKNLFPKVLKKMKQEEIIMALYELDRAGSIRMEQKGKIKLLDKHNHITNGRKEAKYVFGTADVTRSGSAYVSVAGMDDDVFIPHKFVHNALQGDEGKGGLTAFGRQPEGE